MNGNYLLDTNIVIGFFADDRNIRDAFAQAEQVSIPTTVLGELFYGASKSTRASENVARIDSLQNLATVLVCDAGTARWYGEIKNHLLKKGKPIPENDIWIAAVALQYDMTLVTRDGHFDEVEMLRVASW